MSDFPLTSTKKKSQSARFCITHTIATGVSKTGVGLFSGQLVTLNLLPLPKGEGVFFQRIDLPGNPTCPAYIDYVQGTPRCTIIGTNEFSIQTVEHLLAAFHAYKLQDVLVQVSGPEVPIFDGSSLPFVEMIEEAGVVVAEEKEEFLLEEPLYFSENGISIIAIPSAEYKVTYTLDYPNCEVIGTQFFSLALDRENFRKEIAPCRTFSVYEEILPLMQKGILRGGDLGNAVVIKEGKILNKEGLRLPQEMVRHKILDMFGDLYLAGCFFSAHIIGIRSGHHANSELAKKITHYFRGEVRHVERR